MATQQPLPDASLTARPTRYWGLDVCTLEPPNSHLLSEEVISGVILHSDNYRKTNGAGIGCSEIKQTRDTTSIAHVDVAVHTLPVDHERKSLERSRILVSKRLQPDQLDSDNSQLSSASVRNPVVIAKLLKLAVDLERKRRRVNQARYLQKKNDSFISLEKEVEDIRREIEALEKHRQVLSIGTERGHTVWNVAVVYFRLFGKTSRASARSTETSAHLAQEMFVRSTLVPNVFFNSERGVTALLGTWRYLSLWFKDLDVDLEELWKTARGSVVATTTTSFTITEQTIRSVFAHLEKDEIGGRKSLLTRKLVGQRIKLQGKTHFEWDESYGLVTSIVSQADLLKPMLQLLETIENVSTVFNQALVSLEFQPRLKQKASRC